MILTIKIYVGFHACIHKWCLQSGTTQQYTKCQSVSVDGRTCYNPSIKYGSTIGGIPNKHGQRSWHGHNVYKEWCQQLFPTSNIIKSSVTYSNYKPTNFIGSVFWCRSYDETYPHWCDWSDGYWKDSTLDNKYNKLSDYGSQVINSLTCQI